MTKTSDPSQVSFGKSDMKKQAARWNRIFSQCDQRTSRGGDGRHRCTRRVWVQARRRHWRGGGQSCQPQVSASTAGPSYRSAPIKCTCTCELPAPPAARRGSPPGRPRRPPSRPRLPYHVLAARRGSFAGQPRHPPSHKWLPYKVRFSPVQYRIPARFSCQGSLTCMCECSSRWYGCPRSNAAVA